MEKQNRPDALDRALTDLYRADVPQGYRAAWRAAVQREELPPMKQKQPLHKKPLWRVALPIAAALVLVFGAVTAGRLIPTVVNDTYYSSPAPMVQAKRGAAPGEGGGGSAPDSTQYAAESTYGMVANSDVEFAAMAPAGGAQPMAADARTANAGDTVGAAAGTAETSGAKIVRTADLTIATTRFDADSQAVAKLTESLGGYIASVNVSGEASPRMDRVAYYNLRIPSAKLDAFLSGLNGVGRITYRYETSTDMTTQYADTNMRLTTQQAKMARLQELMKQATDVSDLLEIETEVANTQYEIDSLQSSLLTIDRDVDKSSVSVTVQEQSAGDTAQAVELTLWQRLTSGFEASVKGLGAFGQNLLVFLAMLVPVLIPLALVALLIVWLVRRRRAHRAEHTDATTEPADASHTPAAGEPFHDHHDTPNGKA